MRRLLALVLTGSLLLTPALAAGTDQKDLFPAVREPVSFSDVADGSWYTDAVALCYETGLINGTGEGKFSPDATVTIGEAAALACRIHQILNGGSGELPHARAEWGQITVTRSRQARAGQPRPPNLHGTHYPGTTTWMIWHSTPSLRFELSDPNQYDDAYYEDLWTATRRPSSDLWYRDTTWYLETVLGADLYQMGYMGQTATRLDFVQLLGLVSDGLLEPINDITDVPDCNGTLSRGELATMAARLIRPELRQQITLKS